MLDGFHHGPDCEKLNFAMIREALEESVELLPSNKPRFFLGPAPPHLVFDLVEAGIDVFDCSYPNLVTERDSMLVFPYTLDGTSALCAVRKVYFSAQPNKLRHILNFDKYYPIEHIFVPACSSARKIHFFKF